jgi:hypothetical protein
LGVIGPFAKRRSVRSMVCSRCTKPSLRTVTV